MTTTSTPSKTAGTSLVSLQNVGANAEVIGTDLDVSGKFSALAIIHFGRNNNGTPATGVTFRFETNFGADVAGEWAPIASYLTGVTGAHTGTNTSTSTNAQTISSTTGFAVQGVCLVHDGTIANTEWARIKTVTSGTVLTMEENLVNSHTTGSTYDAAEIVTVALDLSGAKRLRCVVDGSAHNQTFDVEVILNTLDSVVSA